MNLINLHSVNQLWCFHVPIRWDCKGFPKTESQYFLWFLNHTVTYSCVHTNLSFSICYYSKSQFKWLHWWQKLFPAGILDASRFFKSTTLIYLQFGPTWDLTLTLLAAIWINYFNHCSLRFTALGITEPGKWKTTQDRMRVMSGRVVTSHKLMQLIVKHWQSFV